MFTVYTIEMAYARMRELQDQANRSRDQRLATAAPARRTKRHAKKR
ncbi:hypothetical protein [Streptomyces sp. NBC_01306]|nr:hypothetical protein [Streptomyces sp. NBC_01306]MCX4724675.1 hypothetical protein [Streptomyces sp. NBC_01306]